MKTSLSDNIIDRLNQYRWKNGRDAEIIKINSINFEILLNEIQHFLTSKTKSKQRQFCGADIVVDNSVDDDVIILCNYEKQIKLKL